jgi:cell division transport system ATP-binding protein
MLLSFNKVSKTFGKQVKALDNVSFKVEDGEFVFLVGPSGAGKTTLIRLIIRDLLPTSGTIKLDELDLTKIKPAEIPKLRRQIGVVFQDFKILQDRTIAENVAMPLEITGQSSHDTMHKVKEVLQIVGLEDKLHYFPVQLSAGELQRAAIARAIISAPKILLADEPTGNLDPVTSWEILKILKEINKMGTTVIMSTHNMDIVNSMKKRVIQFKKGTVVKDEATGRYI